MKVVIRLQQAGYRNHPKWKIVVMGWKKNPRGRYLEQLGWWQPRQGIINQREIVINKERARYWLAMGASPSTTVQKFLSYYDLAAKPLIKFGQKTVYDRPEPVVKDYLRLNPYKIVNFDSSINDYIQQEEDAKIIKQERMKNELIKQIGSQTSEVSLDPTEIKTEIAKLQDELANLSSSMNQVDPKRRQLVVKRINTLFPQLLKAEKHEAYKQKVQEGKSLFADTVGKDKALKRDLELSATNERLNQSIESLDEKYEALKPISKEEFKDFLLSKGFYEAKADKTVRRYFTDHAVVQKIHAIEATTDVPDIEYDNQYHNEKYRMNEKIVFPLPNSITPRPNLNSYDAADYYEIPRLYDPTLQGNKAYSLPGITDKINPQKNTYMKIRPKNVQGGRKPRRDRNQNLPKYAFSTAQNKSSSSSLMNATPYFMTQFQYLNFKNAASAITAAASNTKSASE